LLYESDDGAVQWLENMVTTALRNEMKLADKNHHVPLVMEISQNVLYMEIWMKFPRNIH